MGWYVFLEKPDNHDMKGMSSAVTERDFKMKSANHEVMESATVVQFCTWEAWNACFHLMDVCCDLFYGSRALKSCNDESYWFITDVRFPETEKHCVSGWYECHLRLQQIVQPTIAAAIKTISKIWRKPKFLVKFVTLFFFSESAEIFKNANSFSRDRIWIASLSCLASSSLHGVHASHLQKKSLSPANTIDENFNSSQRHKAIGIFGPSCILLLPLRSYLHQSLDLLSLPIVSYCPPYP